MNQEVTLVGQGGGCATGKQGFKTGGNPGIGGQGTDTEMSGDFISIKKNPEGALAVRDYLSSLQFSTLFATTLKLQPGDCQSLSGNLDIEARLAITFFIQPF